MDDIRIQIVNFKTKRYLLECLASVAEDLKSFSDKYSVAILDNASGDDLSDLSSQFPQLKIEIHQTEKNLGFGAGHNLLAKQGEAQWLLLLNPDMRFIQPETIRRLICCARDSQADVVGPRIAGMGCVEFGQ